MSRTGDGTAPARVKRPSDSQALNPAAWKLAIGVAVGVAVFLALLSGGIAAAGHRNDVISHLTADWRSLDGDASVQLSISPSGDDSFGLSDVPAVTPLELSGKVDGRPVRAEVKVPRWPPMGSTAFAIVDGTRWQLRIDLARDRLALVTDEGRAFALTSTR